ncbi:restriction endonuclease [Methylocella sp.]|jgi:restriction system protein|uniref:restriction endonuclease n=1 Tax=Methylocella sp. TaxID=1978226 RepID=UPI003C14745A
MLARETLRAAREKEKAEKRLRKEMEQRAALNDKNSKRDYVEGRIAQAESLNSVLEGEREGLRTILARALEDTTVIRFTDFLRHPDENDLGEEFSRQLFPEPQRDKFLPARPSLLAAVIPGTKRKYAAKLKEAEARFADAFNKFEDFTNRRRDALTALYQEANLHNQTMKDAEEALKNNDPEAIRSYFELVLRLSDDPPQFPKKLRVAFVPESKQLVFDYQLPTLEHSIPAIEKYRYIKSTDKISETKAPERSRQILYTNVISQIALRCLHRIFAADNFQQIDVVALNAYIATIDLRTGRPVQPYVISVRTTRSEFAEIDLSRVEPISCLKHLSASISRSPSELVAVRPIVDLNMVDPRFIQEQDILSALDNRQNLMDLNPSEFESLITNLFQKMGLHTKLTQASRDGGVDCVAFDPRPILGGKVIVQAKRYKNTVGVSSVRDLFGTMHNEGASKGILVTTSGYGKAAFEFANGKPIELISGSNLLYLLKEHADIDAKIEMPDDWVDAQPDAAT